MANIHPSAIVDPEARIHDSVTIGPFCVIGPHVQIGAHSILHSHVVVEGHTTIGENNQFFQFASIGAPPQDNSYKGEPTRVEIGNNNIFREYVSVHRGTLKENGFTRVGNNCLFMSYVHIGHDVIIGNYCTIANSTNFAGHVKIGDRVGIGGGTNIQQFVKLGRGAYIGGASAIDRDIPTFCTAIGNRAHLKGINIIGMKRQGHSKQEISEVVDFIRTIESSNLSPRAFIDHPEFMREFKDNVIVQEISEQIRSSEIGIAPFNP